MPVFPLAPRSKVPLAGSKGVHDATTDPEKIDRWWKQEAEGNIAGAVPEGYILLDVDGSEGRASIAGQHLPHTVTATTPREDVGHHYWYRLPEGVTATNRAILPGVDLKAFGGKAFGGYAVLPPSVHPDTGRRYEWSSGCAPWEVQLAEAPEWLVELLAAPPEKPSCSDAPGRRDVATGGLPETIHEGTRNVTLFTHGCRLRGRGASREMILEGLLTANRLRCRPPLLEKEVRRIARSAASYAVGPVRISNRILNSRIISDQAKMLAMLMALTGDRLTQAEMADLWGVSRSKVKRALRELREADLLDAAREYPKRHYTRVHVEALLNDTLSDGAKVQYATLARLDVDGDAQVQVGQEKLEERLGKKRTQIGRDTQELEAVGLLTVSRTKYAGGLGRRQHTNRYRLPLLSGQRSSVPVALSDTNGSSMQRREEEEEAAPPPTPSDGSSMQRPCSTTVVAPVKEAVGRSSVGCTRPHAKLDSAPEGAKRRHALDGHSSETTSPPAAKQPLQPTAAEGEQEGAVDTPSHDLRRQDLAEEVAATSHRDSTAKHQMARGAGPATVKQVQGRVRRRTGRIPHELDAATALAITGGDVEAAVSLILDDLRQAGEVPDALLEETASLATPPHDTLMLEAPPPEFTKQAIPPSGPVVSPEVIVAVAEREGLDPEEVHQQIEAGLLVVCEEAAEVAAS
jgi:biotin operon repressor